MFASFWQCRRLFDLQTGISLWNPQNWLKRPILTYRFSVRKCAETYFCVFCISFLSCFPRRTRCSWQETKVWNPGATPNPSWSMNGGSSWVWIWTLIPASNDVSSVDKKRLGHLQQGWWFVCIHCPAWSIQQQLLLIKWRKSFAAVEYLSASEWKTSQKAKNK